MNLSTCYICKKICTSIFQWNAIHDVFDVLMYSACVCRNKTLGCFFVFMCVHLVSCPTGCMCDFCHRMANGSPPGSLQVSFCHRMANGYPPGSLQVSFCHMMAKGSYGGPCHNILFAIKWQKDCMGGGGGTKKYF